MLNKVFLMGRFVRDPENRTTKSGKSAVSFTLAVERDYAPEGQNREVDFLNCMAWGGTADLISRYFSKGSLATVCGRIEVRSYTDRDGNNQTATNIQVDNIYFGGEKRSSKSDEKPKQSNSGARGKNGYSSTDKVSQQSFVEMDDADDDLPF